jgi:hypothetical protein
VASDSPTEVEAIMLLCDAAQSVGGKLYILGAGWSQVPANPGGLAMALAIKLAIPWSRANERLSLRAALVTDEGYPVPFPGGVQPIEAPAEVEVGRPPGLKHGTPLDASLAMNVSGIVLAPGGYVWNLEVEGDIKARVPFRVLG